MLPVKLINAGVVPIIFGGRLPERTQLRRQSALQRASANLAHLGTKPGSLVSRRPRHYFSPEGWKGLHLPRHVFWLVFYLYILLHQYYFKLQRNCRKPPQTGWLIEGVRSGLQTEKLPR